MVKIADIWSELPAEVERRGGRLYPGLVVDEEGYGREAPWPTDDWRAFLDLAQHVQAKIVYGWRFEFDDAAIERLRGRRAAEIVAAAAPDVDAHRGKAYAVDISFVHEGVLHSFYRAESWYESLSKRVERDNEASWRKTSDSRTKAEMELFARTDEIADPLSETREFYAAANDGERRAVARRISAELDIYLQPGNHLGFFARMIIDEASRRSREIVRPRLITEAKANLDRYVEMARRDAEFSEATTKKDRERSLRRLVLAEMGFSDAGLVSAIERAARTTTDG